MQHLMFTVFDAKTKAFLPPFYMQTEPQAVRAFADAVNGGNEQFSRHPEDYTMHSVGYFDDATGVLHASPPTIVASALQVSNQARKERV